MLYIFQASFQSRLRRQFRQAILANVLRIPAMILLLPRKDVSKKSVLLFRFPNKYQARREEKRLKLKMRIYGVFEQFETEGASETDVVKAMRFIRRIQRPDGEPMSSEVKFYEEKINENGGVFKKIVFLRKLKTKWVRACENVIKRVSGKTLHFKLLN
jgi:hypothetical protein